MWGVYVQGLDSSGGTCVDSGDDSDLLAGVEDASEIATTCYLPAAVGDHENGSVLCPGRFRRSLSDAAEFLRRRHLDVGDPHEYFTTQSEDPSGHRDDDLSDRSAHSTAHYAVAGTVLGVVDLASSQAQGMPEMIQKDDNGWKQLLRDAELFGFWGGGVRRQRPRNHDGLRFEDGGKSMGEVHEASLSYDIGSMQDLGILNPHLGFQWEYGVSDPGHCDVPLLSSHFGLEWSDDVNGCFVGLQPIARNCTFLGSPKFGASTYPPTACGGESELDGLHDPGSVPCYVLVPHILHSQSQPAALVHHGQFYRAQSLPAEPIYIRRSRTQSLESQTSSTADDSPDKRWSSAESDTPKCTSPKCTSPALRAQEKTRP